jgi:hypothetical protein
MLQGDENHFRLKLICSLDAISRRRVFLGVLAYDALHQKLKT